MKARIFSLVALLACIPWLGGLLVLGAIVAPTVFGIVHAPDSADAMTVVFRRFDRVAIAASAIVLVCEVGLATTTRTLRDAVRAFLAIAMSALAIYEGTMLSPQIEALHRAGATRGSGDLGLELERAHRAAEMVGKSELLFGVVYVVLLVFTIAALPGTKVANVVASSATRTRTDDESDQGGGNFRRDEA
jgi:uncharacterized membrane protein